MSYREESIALFTVLDHFARDYGLPSSLFGRADHITFTATSTKDFGQRVNELSRSARQLTVVERENRWVATALLSGTLVVAELGRLNWVNVIEPTDTEIELGIFDSDVLGFRCANPVEAEKILLKKGLSSTTKVEPLSGIHVPIMEAGVSYEIGLYDSYISELVHEDIIAERATFVDVASK